MTDDSIRSFKCWVCDAEVLMRADRMAKLKANGFGFYCTNGHHLSWTVGKTEIEKERDALAARLATAERRAANALAAERKTRLDANRCPHCSRRFESAEKLKAHQRRVHEKARALPKDAGPSN